MGYNASKTEQKRFTAFTKELAELSKKHGIVLQSIGGVTIADLKDKDLQKLSYTDDATSGDLEPLNWFEG